MKNVYGRTGFFQRKNANLLFSKRKVCRTGGFLFRSYLRDGSNSGDLRLISTQEAAPVGPRLPHVFRGDERMVSGAGCWWSDIVLFYGVIFLSSLVQYRPF